MDWHQGRRRGGIEDLRGTNGLARHFTNFENNLEQLEFEQLQELINLNPQLATRLSDMMNLGRQELPNLNTGPMQPATVLEDRNSGISPLVRAVYAKKVMESMSGTPRR